MHVPAEAPSEALHDDAFRGLAHLRDQPPSPELSQTSERAEAFARAILVAFESAP